ncbi:MAG: hypothetical protein GY756_13920 [bacterium]|nr:hypothetical protein [bacterium]
MVKINKKVIIDNLNKVNYKGIAKFLFCNPLFTIIVTVPMIIAILYYLLIASSRYESTATLVLQQNESIPSSFSITSLLTNKSSKTFNAFLYIDYVKSFDMFSKLNKKISLLKLYQTKKADWFSRLSSGNPEQDKILGYYESMLSVKFNSESSGIDLSAEAFTPEDSYKIVKSIISISQSYINGINKQLVQQKLDFNRKLMNEAKTKLHNAKLDIIKFQNKYNVIDPSQAVQLKITIMSELMAQLAQAETQMISMKTKLSHSSTQVRRLQTKINGIKEQIKVEKNKILNLTGNEIVDPEKKHKPNMDGDTASNKKLNYILSQFQWLKMNLEYSSKMYESSLQAFEAERIAISKNQVQLLVIDPPYIPDYAKYPRTLYILTSLLIILLMVFGITRMIITIIKEHRY